MQRTCALIGIVVIGLTTTGCTTRDDGGGSGQASTSVPAPGVTGAQPANASAPETVGGAPPPSVDAPLPAPQPIDEAAVRRLVDAWLAAQNSGDFAAYQALYADRMEGVKRVGPRTWRFDRAGWLADRERMFRQPMTVGASNVTIRGSAVAPTVELVQTFRQGSFGDEGPKQLVLVQGPGGLRIAREEMLRSDVAGAQAGAGAVHLVMEVDGRHYVVIARDADPAWGEGPIDGPFTGLHLYALRVAPSAPASPAWQGRQLAVYAADGTRCDASVGSLSLLGGGTPHFGEVQVWDGNPEMSPDGRVWSRAERARTVFDMGELYLVGELTVTGGCRPAFAVDAGRTVTLFRSEPAPPPSAAAALAAFRRLPGYARLQADFATNYGGQGAWARSPQVTAFAAGDARYLVVTGSEGTGCGEFYGRLFALFADRGGRVELVSAPTDVYVRIDAILDSDGDGQIEILGAAEDFHTVTAHYRPVRDGVVPTAEASFAFRDCGC